MRVFEYPDVRTKHDARPVASADPVAHGQSQAPVSSDLIADQLIRARAEGINEGKRLAQESATKAVLEERSRLDEALKKFDVEKADYYARIEVEVVKLALTVASKILHREAQVDPMLVAALVRVALDKFHKNTRATVRVRPEEASSWRQYFAQHMEQSSLPEVIEDSAVQPHGCLLETDLGSTELGINTQLQEIENGLFDLLAQRPDPK